MVTVGTLCAAVGGSVSMWMSFSFLKWLEISGGVPVAPIPASKPRSIEPERLLFTPESGVEK